MMVLCPCDGNEMRLAVEALVNYEGPAYMRLGRLAVETVTDSIPGYSFELGKVTTATEYTGSRQDLVQNANKNQIPIETALIGILRAMLWAAKNLLGAPVDPETSISVNWDDSYIVSEAERTSQLREDALAGLVPRCRYLSARYSLSEEEAHQWTAEAKADSQTEETLTFGGGV